MKNRISYEWIFIHIIAIAFTVCTLRQPATHTSERCDYLKEIIIFLVLVFSQLQIGCLVPTIVLVFVHSPFSIQGVVWPVQITGKASGE